jgi:phenylalanyl-tRNA synthetase alpha subunit
MKKIMSNLISQILHRIYVESRELFVEAAEQQGITVKALTKQQIAKKQTLLNAIYRTWELLEQEIESYNTGVGKLRVSVEEAIENLNSAIRAAEEWRDQIQTNMTCCYEGKSELWQEGDAGQTYYTWMENWDIGLEEINLDFPDELEAPDCEAISLLEILPDAP